MKAKLFSIIAILFISTTTIFAQNVMTYTNVDKTDSGCIKEYIAYDSFQMLPIKKEVYVENASGQKISKASYKWADNRWVGVQKVNYKFNSDNKTEMLVYSKWDAKIGDWSDSAEHLSYMYNNDGELIASFQIHSTIADTLLTVLQ